jgi:hypothetical protein
MRAALFIEQPEQKSGAERIAVLIRRAAALETIAGERS